VVHHLKPQPAQCPAHHADSAKKQVNTDDLPLAVDSSCLQEQRALYLVVVAVPGDKVGYALLHRGGGLVAHGALELGGVGVGVGYVAGL